MIYHASSVIRGTSRSLVVVDLPFGSYQSNSKEALVSTFRIMKETGAHAIKLEGGEEVQESVKRIIAAGVPVMGHLGLTPQSIYKFGTYNVRAKEQAEAEKLRNDAKLLQEAGCFGLVLEKIPATLAKEVSESLQIPTIGIGAGKFCDGQVLVMHDMLGINTEFKPRFLRQYLNQASQNSISGGYPHPGYRIDTEICFYPSVFYTCFGNLSHLRTDQQPPAYRRNNPAYVFSPFL